MVTCEILREGASFYFQCSYTEDRFLVKSNYYLDKEILLDDLIEFMNSGHRDFVYESCDGDQCFYFVVKNNNETILLESRPFESREKVYDAINEMKSGCPANYIIDKSFSEGNVKYYISCTPRLNFKHPLEISLSKEDGEFIGSISDLHIFAYSEIFDELIEEIKTDVDELYFDLFENSHSLSTRAQMTKNLLESKLEFSGV